jgi:hypothetical protein
MQLGLHAGRLWERQKQAQPASLIVRYRKGPRVLQLSFAKIDPMSARRVRSTAPANRSGSGAMRTEANIALGSELY